MKDVLNKSIAFLMALVVLFSTMSFILDMHYCGDTLVDTSIFKKAEGCGMAMDKHIATSEEVNKKGCCTEKQIIFQGQDELQLLFNKINFEKQLFVTSFIHSYISLFETFEENAETFSGYPPPLIVKNIYKLDETYLI